MQHYLLNDTTFEKILKFLKQIKGIHTNNTKRLRAFIEVINYLCRGGIPIRMLPYYHGHWRAVHKRFMAWSRRGIWKKMFKYFQQDPDMEWINIDSTIVRAHACAAGYKKNSQEQEALGRSKGGFSTKIHAITDALGNPLEFLLTPGQRNDITQAKLLCENLINTVINGDKGYDSDDFIQSIADQGCKANIPPRKNRKHQREYDTDLYAERHGIECCFGKMKHFRKVSSRFDKTAQAYLSILYFVGALLWLR